jgi:hypothetical protein
MKWRESVKCGNVVLCEEVEEEADKAKISLELSETWIRRLILEDARLVKCDRKVQNTLVLLVYWTQSQMYCSV